MNITLIAIGVMGRGPEKALMETYQKRLPWSFSVKELEIKKRLSGDALKVAEGEAILAALPEGAAVIALDERGKNLSSREFAGKIEGFQLAGRSKLALIIGGADGLSDAVRARADLLLSFGKLTWPHMMVRAMISEQLYRAHSILTNHPYHRD